jgi:hypothetical protein
MKDSLSIDDMPFYNISYPKLCRDVLSIAILEVSFESIRANLNVIGTGMLFRSPPHGFPQQLDVMSGDSCGVRKDFCDSNRYGDLHSVSCSAAWVIPDY